MLQKASDFFNNPSIIYKRIIDYVSLMFDRLESFVIDKRVLIFLISLSFFMRICTLFNPFIWSDSIDYINLGQNIWENRTFSLDYRTHYFDGGLDIPHESYQRAPFYSILISPIASFDNLVLINLVNILIFYLFIYYYYSLIKDIFSYNISVLSTLLLCFHPIFFEISVLPSSEPLFLLLSILSLKIFFSDDQWRISKVGILLGLAYLTRPISLIFLLSITLFLFLNRKKKILKLWLFFILAISPWLIRNYLVFNDPFYSSYNFQNDFASYHNFYHYYSGPIESPTFFERVYYSIDAFWDYSKLMPGMGGLLLLFPFTIIFCCTAFWPVNKKFILNSIVTSNLVLMSISYSTTHGVRFLIPTILFAIPFSIDILSKIRVDVPNFSRYKFLIIIFCLICWSVQDTLLINNNNANTKSLGDLEITLENKNIVCDREEYLYYYTEFGSYHLPDLDSKDFMIYLNDINADYILLMGNSGYNSEIINKLYASDARIDEEGVIFILESDTKDYKLYSLNYQEVN